MSLFDNIAFCLATNTSYDYSYGIITQKPVTKLTLETPS